jgi:fermentation-respiration switch protein FrsA (DUF1100 family)
MASLVSAGLKTGRYVLVLMLALSGVVSAEAQTTEQIVLRGHRQTLHLYGPRGGDSVIVSSGDGGWMHLAPHVAERLAARGFFVVGFDVKAYLESFTAGAATLRAEDEPEDYRTLIEYAPAGSRGRPALIGVSEGAGLSVLAAADPRVKPLISGVVGLGLPNVNELGWRWQDSLIYLTHGTPKEPSFRTIDVAAHVSPVPLGAIHATSDEYVPMGEVQQVMGSATEPKRLWIVKASNHSFSDNLPELEARLIDALDWVRQHQVR